MTNNEPFYYQVMNKPDVCGLNRSLTFTRYTAALSRAAEFVRKGLANQTEILRVNIATGEASLAATLTKHKYGFSYQPINQLQDKTICQH